MKLVYEKVIEQDDLAKATEGAAAFDLRGFTGEGKSVSLFPNQSVALRTGVKFDIPSGHVLKLFSRSGLGFKYDITLSNSVGIVDSDFKKEVLVKLVNKGKDVMYIDNGMRIAQAILEKLEVYTLEAGTVEDTTDRDGFGSTGTGKIKSDKTTTPEASTKNSKKSKKEESVDTTGTEESVETTGVE